MSIKSLSPDWNALLKDEFEKPEPVQWLRAG